MLKIENLVVTRENEQILNGVNVAIKEGSFDILMGPNGSGKSTLANAIMGSSDCQVVHGSIFFQGKEINDISTDKRAKMGIFMSFQHPVEVFGVSMYGFLKTAYKELGNTPSHFDKELKSALSALDLSEDFLRRNLNEGFSGGEKKKSEILQLMLFKPKFAILDELDSGLDISALKVAMQSIILAQKQNPKMAILMITHYPKVVENFAVQNVHIMQNGAIVKSGGKEIIGEIEKKGYGQ